MENLFIGFYSFLMNISILFHASQGFLGLLGPCIFYMTAGKNLLVPFEEKYRLWKGLLGSLGLMGF